MRNNKGDSPFDSIRENKNNIKITTFDVRKFKSEV
jgi:hypothetical protein